MGSWSGRGLSFMPMCTPPLPMCMSCVGAWWRPGRRSMKCL
uniref:Uncharacterized protein n=1 Tax=Arundo donax TaxID=35708 RepID=A0A0A9BXI2_ARUDO